VVAKLRGMMEGTRPATIAQALAAMRDRPDRTGVLGGSRVPTLVIVGERDVITPPDVTGAMAAKIPGAEHRVIAGVGHMTNMESPSEVNRILGEFLERMKAEG
jgi:pimeloyl-ACP methyl ester carboxylesterase